jgi:hypothetical protein
MCEHKDFEAHVAVNRMEDTGQFAADVHIRCKDCETPFQFLGLPTGLNSEGAAVSVDATEARLAIAPYDDANTILGGLPKGLKSFRVIRGGQ